MLDQVGSMLQLKNAMGVSVTGLIKPESLADQWEASKSPFSFLFSLNRAGNWVGEEKARPCRFIKQITKHFGNEKMKKPQTICYQEFAALLVWRGRDSNPRPSGYAYQLQFSLPAPRGPFVVWTFSSPSAKPLGCLPSSLYTFSD